LARPLGLALATTLACFCAVPPKDFAADGPGEEPPTPLQRLGADRWHRAGCRGRGVTVAVLDSGFRGYRDHLGHALPGRVAARTFRRDGDLEAKDSRHGILCAEVVHALAPEAGLLLANWEPERPEQFLAAARWARAQGARVLTCSLIMPQWSDGEGNGPVHEELARLLGDALFFASAGNVAQRHWSGEYRDGGRGWHEWEPGQADNGLTPWGPERVSVELCGRAGSEYELALVDAHSGRDVRRAAGGPNVALQFLPQPARRYAVRLRLRGGRPGAFHLVALGGWLQCATARGSIPFPGDGPEVIAVGAVDAAGRRAAYSSCGPNSSQPKPDFVAAVPFPSRWRAQPFSGTSAAAPQAAALAALLWSRHPDWNAARVRAALRAAARDLGPPGHDHETGYGHITLPPEE
jgi:hypothetical protein